jgi:hypothetical protein
MVLIVGCRLGTAALGTIFAFLIHRHLLFTIFPCLVNTGQLMGQFWINKSSGTSDVALILLAQYIICT